MKKVEKTTRPFRYDLNQIPYLLTYLLTVEVRNRFKLFSALYGLVSYVKDKVPSSVWFYL